MAGNVIQFPCLFGGPKQPRANLVRIVDDEGSELCLQVKLFKDDLRSVLTHVLQEDAESMLIGVNIEKDRLRRYNGLFAVLLGCGGQ